MKTNYYLLITLLALCLTGCFFSGTLRGWHIELFEDTPVWKLAKAVEKNDTTKIKKLLKKQKHITNIDFQEPHYGMTLLEWAVYNNKYPSTLMLARHGANPNIISKDGETAFIMAAGKYETSDYLRTLIAHGGDLNFIIPDSISPVHYRTPLIASASTVKLDNVKLLLEAGADMNLKVGNKKNEAKQSAVTEAALMGRMDILNYLIIEKEAHYDFLYGIALNNDSIYLTHDLRNMFFPLDSEDHKKKMKLVAYLKERGMDYWETPLPINVKVNYDSAYCARY